MMDVDPYLWISIFVVFISLTSMIYASYKIVKEAAERRQQNKKED
jgi:hypothetical protein